MLGRVGGGEEAEGKVGVCSNRVPRSLGGLHASGKLLNASKPVDMSFVLFFSQPHDGS